MNTKRWTYRTTLSESQQIQAEALAKSINVNPFLGQLLVQRGITTFDEAKDFFRPSLAHLHNPFLMKDMDKACLLYTSSCKLHGSKYNTVHKLPAKSHGFGGIMKV